MSVYELEKMIELIKKSVEFDTKKADIEIINDNRVNIIVDIKEVEVTLSYEKEWLSC